MRWPELELQCGIASEFEIASELERDDITIIL